MLLGYGWTTERLSPLNNKDHSGCASLRRYQDFPIASRPLWDGQVSSTSHAHHSRLRHNRPKQEDQVAMNRNHNQTKHLFILGYLVQAFCWSNGILTRWEVQGSTSFCLMFPKVLNSVFWIAPWTLYLHEGRSAVLIKEGQFIPEGGICIL